MTGLFPQGSGGVGDFRRGGGRGRGGPRGGEAMPGSPYRGELCAEKPGKHPPPPIVSSSFLFSFPAGLPVASRPCRPALRTPHRNAEPSIASAPSPARPCRRLPDGSQAPIIEGAGRSPEASALKKKGGGLTALQVATFAVDFYCAGIASMLTLFSYHLCGPTKGVSTDWLDIPPSNQVSAGLGLRGRGDK